MRKTISASLLLVSMLAAAGILAQQPKQPDIDLQAAIRTESVKGDLRTAIKQYESIVTTYSNDRVIVAQALVHMAGCYQKLGDTEARKIYERVVREYGDQKDAVTAATAHLRSNGSGGTISRQAWAGPQVDTYGAVSPDGRYISFTATAAWRGMTLANIAPGAIAVHDLRNGSDREIERFRPGDEGEESVISKDGKLIVYTVFNAKENRYQLRIANVDGSPTPRLLFNNPDVDWIAAYDWSPDSRSVLALVKRKDRTAQIGFVSIPDGSLRILKSVDWRATGRIFLTPDGKYLGYDLPASDSNREHDVFVLSADGTRELTAIAHPSLNFMMGWSADGKWLVFASNRTGSMSLWALPFVDGKVQGTPELVRPDIGRIESMGMTRSGHFYYGLRADTQPSSRIQVVSQEPGSNQFSTATPIPKEHIASDTQPSWSPDGNLLAYISNRGNSGSSLEQGGQRITVVVIRSSKTMGLVREFDLNLNGNIRLMRWTAEGRELLVTGIDAKGRPGLFRVDTQTGEMSAIGFASLRPGEWPDGEWKMSADAANLYVRRTPGCDVNCSVVALMRRDLKSGTDQELIRSYQLGFVNLSPNDQYIATPVPEPATNSRTFVVIPATGGRPRELMRVATGNPDGETGPNRKGRALGFAAWSTDSRAVFIREMLDGKPVAIWRAALDGTPPQKLAWDADQIGAEQIAVHPEGSRIAYIAPVAAGAQRGNEVWLLENFLPPGKSSR